MPSNVNYFEKILVTNDDGINGIGLKILVEQLLKKYRDVVIVAPAKQNSAVSQKMTLNEGLKLERVEFMGGKVTAYSLSGTPTDCIKVALNYLLIKPTIIISGMNEGLNLGNDILYSGTVGACFEAGLSNIKSIAFSTEKSQLEAGKYINSVIDYINENSLLNKYDILNVNLNSDFKGIKLTKQGKNPFNTRYTLKDGLLFVGGNPLGFDMENDECSDIYSYKKGSISITPLTVDRTKY